MEGFAIALIMAGTMLLRQVAVGRSHNVREDTRDFFTALLHGDVAGVVQVSARRGTNIPDITTDTSTNSGANLGTLAASPSGNAMIDEAHRLAAVANNTYVWGAEGPAAYDCSGLVWRVLHNLNIYQGTRFTAGSFPGIAGKFAQHVDTPAVGDIVVWPGHHMGFVVGDGVMFSALNHNVGIIQSPISDGGSMSSAQFWRVTTQTANPVHPHTGHP